MTVLDHIHKAFVNILRDYDEGQNQDDRLESLEFFVYKQLDILCKYENVELTDLWESRVYLGFDDIRNELDKAYRREFFDDDWPKAARVFAQFLHFFEKEDASAVMKSD